MIQTFNRSKLAAYLSCQRRYQLRYLEERSWPAAPLAGQEEEARYLGERFHQLIHQYILGLPVNVDQAKYPRLYAWWKHFQEYEAELPEGDRYTEVDLNVPIGQSRLSGRVDLLIYSREATYIFDWKTGSHPYRAGQVGSDLQSIIYLALIVQASSGLPQPVDPDTLSLTYLYVDNPGTPLTIAYNWAKHIQNWEELQALIAEITSQIPTRSEWSKTDDLRHCQKCTFQILCDRVTTPDIYAWTKLDTASSKVPEDQ